MTVEDLDGRYKKKVLVTDELPDGQMVDQWEPIGLDSVQTPLEVAQSFVTDYIGQTA